MRKKRKITPVILFLLCTVFCILTIQTSYASAKTDYTERYNNLEKKCNKKFKYDGSQSEMNQDSYKEYKLWNKELKYVYTSILEHLDETDAAKLEASENKWKKQRKKQATEDAATFEGGTIYAQIFNYSMTEQTKTRIKWLIKNYA